MKIPSRFRAIVPAFCFALLFAGCGGQARGGDLGEGLYLRTLYAFGNLDVSTVYLGPGNQIIMNPDGGIDPLDVSKFDAKTVGKYTVNGDKVHLEWGGGAVAQDLPVEKKDGELTALDGGIVTKAGAYAKAQTLDATYEGSLAVGKVAAVRQMTFTKDGHFTVGTLGAITDSGYVEAHKAGTYTLSGNTLTLTFSDGMVEKHTVIPFSTALDAASAKLDDEKMIFEHMILKRIK